MGHWLPHRIESYFLNYFQNRKNDSFQRVCHSPHKDYKNRENATKWLNARVNTVGKSNFFVSEFSTSKLDSTYVIGVADSE